MVYALGWDAEKWDRGFAAPRDHLDFAIAEFQAMKMTPSLKQALRRKGMLGGCGDPLGGGPPAYVTY
ncbi:MAG: hypothetical protein AAB289_13885 [Chloroflexota bacterium]